MISMPPFSFSSLSTPYPRVYYANGMEWDGGTGTGRRAIIVGELTPKKRHVFFVFSSGKITFHLVVEKKSLVWRGICGNLKLIINKE